MKIRRDRWGQAMIPKICDTVWWMCGNAIYKHTSSNNWAGWRWVAGVMPMWYSNKFPLGPRLPDLHRDSGGEWWVIDANVRPF